MAILPLHRLQEDKGGSGISRGFCARQDYSVRQNVEPEADLVPTMSEVIVRFSQLRIGKAVGEDHLGGRKERT